MNLWQNFPPYGQFVHSQRVLKIVFDQHIVDFGTVLAAPLTFSLICIDLLPEKFPWSLNEGKVGVTPFKTWRGHEYLTFFYYICRSPLFGRFARIYNLIFLIARNKTSVLHTEDKSPSHIGNEAKSFRNKFLGNIPRDVSGRNSPPVCLGRKTLCIESKRKKVRLFYEDQDHIWICIWKQSRFRLLGGLERAWKYEVMTWISGVCVQNTNSTRMPLGPKYGFVTAAKSIQT